MNLDDIRDIRAPLAIPPWWHWPLAIALAAIAALAIVLLVRWWQRRALRRTPLQRAREALDIAEGHAREGRSREWAEVVAETLRGALAARLGADVLPQTTSELAETAWARWAYEGPVEPPRGPNEAHLPEAPRVVELLQTCDLARFAMASLDANALLANTVLARELVEQLFAPRPKPEKASPQRELVTS
jgi:hypothetical protein